MTELKRPPLSDLYPPISDAELAYVRALIRKTGDPGGLAAISVLTEEGWSWIKATFAVEEARGSIAASEDKSRQRERIARINAIAQRATGLVRAGAEKEAVIDHLVSEDGLKPQDAKLIFEMAERRVEDSEKRAVLADSPEHVPRQAYPKVSRRDIDRAKELLGKHGLTKGVVIKILKDEGFSGEDAYAAFDAAAKELRQANRDDT